MLYQAVKTIFDFLVAFVLLLLTVWVFIFCIVILWLTGEHQVWYLQERIGLHNKPFKIFKFVTMLKDSPNMKGGTITCRNDPRVLPFGRFLRITKLNELPQILNVLNGTMSLVGPRPLVKFGFDCYPDEIKDQIYLSKPGITGIGSVIFRDEERYMSVVVDPHQFCRESLFPYKGALEIWYLHNKNFIVDCKILFLTVWVIFLPKSTLPYKFFKDLPPKPEWMD
jgi:lipopolysaccharide/colanic/teichoic acid biosynthesis glycosyltransferase